MEMAHVRYFLALCKERSFTRAARRCGVAQPSLTRAIKILEQELRAPLFHRRPDGVELTALGTEVEPYFAAIERCVAEIKRGQRRVSAVDRRLAKDIARSLDLSPGMNGAPALPARSRSSRRPTAQRAVLKERDRLDASQER